MSELVERLLAEETDLTDCAADHIEQLEESHKELTLQLLATSGQAADALDKLAKAVEALEQITTIIFSAVQGDNEHGVRALNEAAAKDYLKDFPLTLSAITEVQDVINAVLAELEGK